MDGLNTKAFIDALKAWQGVPPFNSEYDAARALALAINTYIALAPIKYVKFPENADEAEAMEKIGFNWLKSHAPERLTEEGKARPLAEIEDWNAKALRDGFPSGVEWIKVYRARNFETLKGAKDAYERNEPFSTTPKTDPYPVLERCRTVLGNMALENPGSWFLRWPIHHEPLRSDARNLLPLIDAALGDAP